MAQVGHIDHRYGGGKASSPEAALSQLRRDARDGGLARLCQEAGIELLVAFGSATDPEWPVPPATSISRSA